MSTGYLSLVPSTESVDAATARIHGAAGKIHSLRLRLASVPQGLTELEQRLATTESDLTRARTQTYADRETIAQLEAKVAEYEMTRSSFASRVAELGRLLGSS